jgi:hypothetical protein
LLDTEVREGMRSALITVMMADGSRSAKERKLLMIDDDDTTVR